MFFGSQTTQPRGLLNEAKNKAIFEIPVMGLKAAHPCFLPLYITLPVPDEHRLSVLKQALWAFRYIDIELIACIARRRMNRSYE